MPPAREPRSGGGKQPNKSNQPDKSPQVGRTTRARTKAAQQNRKGKQDPEGGNEQVCTFYYRSGRGQEGVGSGYRYAQEIPAVSRPFACGARGGSHALLGPRYPYPCVCLPENGEAGPPRALSGLVSPPPSRDSCPLAKRRPAPIAGSQRRSRQAGCPASTPGSTAGGAAGSGSARPAGQDARREPPEEQWGRGQEQGGGGLHSPRAGEGELVDLDGLVAAAAAPARPDRADPSLPRRSAWAGRPCT